MKVSAEILKALGVTFVKESAGISEYVLDSNGLKILLSVRPAKPVVTVMPVYRVGSRNEAVGHTGATHLLEHMMFKGVRDGRTGEVYNFPDRFRPLGGVWNATTWFDRTNYFETVPARHLELCIATESDRMRNLLIKEEEKATEMTVVRNELERGENRPFTVLLQKLYAHAFSEHPYHHPTIGWTSDVEAISAERLKLFYDQYYWPNNTTLLVMGAFDPVQALTWIAKYYGVHPASPAPIPSVHTVEPPQEGEIRFSVVRAAGAAQVLLGYHVPEAAHSDTHALAALTAVLGGSSPNSRLYKSLVKAGIASSCGAVYFEQRDPGMFMISATSAGDHAGPETVEATIRAQLADLAEHPVTDDELSLAKTSRRKQVAIETADPMNLADLLGEAESVAGWTHFTNYEEKLEAVTVEDVKRVAGKYFTDRNLTVGHFIPEVAKFSASQPALPDGTVNGASLEDETGTDPDRGSFSASTVRHDLANGITLLIMPDPATGVVGISAKLKAGTLLSPEDKSLVGALTADQLLSGTKTKSAETIARLTEEMGTGIGFGAGLESVGISVRVAREDASVMLDLLADCLRNPVFPETELAITRARWSTAIKNQMESTEAMAELTLMRALYSKESPFFDKTFEEYRGELDSITAADLSAFHSRFYTPRGMVVAVVGDIEAEAAKLMVENAFGDWNGNEPASLATDHVPPFTEGKRIDVYLKDKRNATIVMGHPSTLLRTADDYLAAKIANAALGSGFTSRLSKVVRLENGLTYGISSQFKHPAISGSPFLIDLSVNPANVDRAIELVMQVVNGLIDSGITEKELSVETGYSSGTFEVQLRNPEAVAATLVEFELIGLGPEALDQYAAKLSALTVDQVNAALRKYIHPEALVTVVAGTLSN